jgi:putative ABC transport system permease protein
LSETVLLVAFGLPPGIAFSAQFARWMGYTQSFLSFTWRQPLSVSPRIENLPSLVFCLGTLLVARLWPLLRAARTSVVAHERVRSRAPQRPLWQRLYLDVLLLVPVAYVYRQLALRGTLVPREAGERALGTAPMAGEDPLLLLVPALFVLALSLLAIRAFPLLMRLGDGLEGLGRRPAPYLAFRQLSRASGAYSHPLLLVILSLGLGTFVASMATSLDQWLADQSYYAVGSDILIEKLIPPGSDVQITPAEEILSGAAAAEEAAFQRSLVSLPLATYRDVPGVVWAARVGTYPAWIPVASASSVKGSFIGIDRVDLPAVLFDRPDFGVTSLGERMNQLAEHENGVLVSEQMMNKGYYQVGDLISVHVDVDGISLDTGFRIVGVYRYFPGVYPTVGKMVESVRSSYGRRRTPYVPPKYVEVDGPPVVVGNLDYLFGQIGTPVATSIWLKLSPGVDRQTVFDHIQSKGVQVDAYRDARADLAQAQARVERVGILGTLTIGFAAATVLSGLGLLIYNYASLQERLFRFTILRAIGLTQGQVVGMVLVEYSVLLLYGVLCGAAIGVLASRLYVPFFQAADQGVLHPPTLVPAIAWREIGWITGVFAAVLVSAQMGVIGAALRRKVFQALRLGDQE